MSLTLTRPLDNFPVIPMVPGYTCKEGLATSTNFRFVCMVSNSCRYTCPYPGTTIYEQNMTTLVSTAIIGPTATPLSGDYSFVAGREYYSDGKPFDIINITDNQQSTAPFSAIGQIFGFASARNSPHIAYVYAPGASGSVSYFYNKGITTGATSTTAVAANTVVAITCSSVDGSHIFTSTVPILMTQTGTANIDHDLVYPMTALQIISVGGTSYDEDYVAGTGNGVSYYSVTSGKRVYVTQIADGSGGNCAGSKDINALRNVYTVGHSMKDYQLAFPYTNTTVKLIYWNGSVWETANTILSGTVTSTTTAVAVQVGSINGVGYPPIVDSLPTCWLFIGDNPFIVRTNDPLEDEYTPLGWNDSTYRAFDGNNATYWDPGVSRYTASTGAYIGPFTTAGFQGDWIQFRDQFPIVSTSYTILGRSGFETTRSPRTFYLLGSNDEINWTLLDTETNVTTWTAGVAKTFTISYNSDYYTYFRLVVNSIGNLTSGGTNQDVVQISTFYVTGSSGTCVMSGAGAITIS